MVFFKSELEDQGDLEQLKEENHLCDSVHIQRKKKGTVGRKNQVLREGIFESTRSYRAGLDHSLHLFDQ